MAAVLLRICIDAPNVDPLTAVARAMICTSTWEANGPSEVGTTPHVDRAGRDDVAANAELEDGGDRGVAARCAERQRVTADTATTITAHHRQPRSISTHLRCTKPQAGSRVSDTVRHQFRPGPATSSIAAMTRVRSCRISGARLVRILRRRMMTV